MVGERSERNVIVHIQAQLLSKTLRRVLLAVVNERFGQLPEIGIENTVEPVGPYGGKFSVRIGHYALHISFEDSLHLAVLVVVGTVLQARIDFVGHNAVFAYHVEYVMRRTALRKFGLAVHAGVLLGLVEIGMARYPHLRKVVIAFAGTEQFALQKSDAGKTPASTAAVLVFDGSSGDILHRRKLIGSLHLLLVGRLGTEAESRQQGGRRHKKSLHSDSLLFFIDG